MLVCNVWQSLWFIAKLTKLKGRNMFILSLFTKIYRDILKADIDIRKL